VYQWPRHVYVGGLQTDWLDFVSVFQKHLLARYAGERMTDFTDLEDKVAKTSFETFTVIANWHKLNAYDNDQHTLPPWASLHMY
jgi:hypothetical protein